MSDHDNEVNPQVGQAFQSASEDIMSGLIGISAEGFTQFRQGLNELKERIKEKQPDKEITVKVGRSNVYKGTPKKGEQSLSKEQGEKLNKALSDPSQSKSTVKVTDSNGETLLHIAKGKIVQDKLELMNETLAQKQQPAPETFYVKETEESMASWRLGEGKPPSFEVSETRTSTIATKTDSGLEVKLNPATKVNAFSRQSLARIFDGLDSGVETVQPAKLSQGNSGTFTLESKGVVAPQKIKETTVAPGLDGDTVITSNKIPEQSTPATVEAELVSEPLSEEPKQAIQQISAQVDEAVKSEDVAGLATVNVSSIDAQLSPEAQVAQLQAKLDANTQAFNELATQFESLSEKMEQLTPMKLANEQLNGWANKQRSGLAEKIHGWANKLHKVADRIAAGSQAHHQATTKLTESIKAKLNQAAQSVDRHDQAVNKLVDQVTDVGHNVVQKTVAAAERIGDTSQPLLSKAEIQKGKEFFQKVANPAVRAVISNMERIGAVTTDEQGNRNLNSEGINWRVDSGDNVQIIDVKSGEQIRPENLNQERLNTIKQFAGIAQAHGYLTPASEPQSISQSESQKQTVAPKLEQPKQIQSEKQQQTLKV